jgi:hypothetical protein
MAENNWSNGFSVRANQQVNRNPQTRRKKKISTKPEATLRI